MQIREATDADWPQLWPVFNEVVQAGETYAYDPELTSDQARDLWMERPPNRVTVATHGEKILGTAKAGPNRPGRGAHVSTASFMVGADARGHGVGRALVEDVLTWARDKGFHSMQFNAVVETNTAAVKLWQAVGFSIIGTVPETFDHPKHGLIGLHVMYQRF